ncbi:MAG: NUDIX domain-containing protein [Nanoarchaeota archaeon]|nr:NUDIX domain-containing protein [Nanoarchaeota archaeon]
MDLYSLPGFLLDGSSTKVTFASGPVIIRDGKVLVHRASSTGKLQFIGGRVDDAKSFQQVAVAKAWDDCGVKVKLLVDSAPLPVLGEIDRHGVKEWVVLVHYLADMVNAAPEIPGEYRWCSLQELEMLNKQGDLSSPNMIIAAKHFMGVK